MSITDNPLAFTFAAMLLTLTPGLDTALVSPARRQTQRCTAPHKDLPRLSAGQSLVCGSTPITGGGLRSPQPYPRTRTGSGPGDTVADQQWALRR